MSRITEHRNIQAPIELVFDTIAHVGNFQKAVSNIVNTEVLSDIKKGVGARFKETRVMRGRENTIELEVTEYEENQRVRFVSTAGGTVWDTVFTVSGGDGGTEMSMTMDAKPQGFLPKLLNPLMMGAVRKAVVGDMDAVKAYCEKG